MKSGTSTHADNGRVRILALSRRRDLLRTTTVALTIALASRLSAEVTGHWDFNDSANGYLATVGADLEPLFEIAARTQFQTVDINGEEATVMAFPASLSRPREGYRVFHRAPPSFGDRVNQYTVIMDIMFPEINDFIALMETHSPITGGLPFDADWFVDASGGIGITGRYHGRLEENTWHRIALAVDNVGRTYDKFIDGVLVNRQLVTDPPLDIDSRFSLGDSFDLFSDENSETAAGFLNSLQFHNRVLSPDEMSALGGATATGIPLPRSIPEPAGPGIWIVTMAAVGVVRMRTG